MPGNGWRTSLVVEAVGLDLGPPVELTTGVIATGGGLQVALRLGECGQTVILPPGAASQLVVNLRRAIAVKMQGDG